MASMAMEEAGAQALAHTAPRIAIIDIGSNSVRLVVYKGLTRTPAVLFNEKVTAGLGRGLTPGGKLSQTAMDLTVSACSRFAQLCDSMGVDSLRAVATAAVRDASNGQKLINRIKLETGIEAEIIDGETEARCAAMGVIAGIPDADGVVGDLGGGSLELVRIAGGEVMDRLSLPLGSLRLDAFRKSSRRSLTHQIDEGLKLLEWAEFGRGKPFYAVGGSWRALAHLHMHLTDWPLPVIHQYSMPADATDRLVRTLAQMTPKSLKQVPSISSSRASQLPGAAAMLKAVVKKLGSSSIITSAYGVREGLLFQSLPEAARRLDPLITAAHEEAERSGRFSDGTDPDVGEALLAFTDPLFAHEPSALRRIRHAASMLADTAWRAHPDMRAEEGLDRALHGNWVGIEPSGRAMLAAALWAVNGGAYPSASMEILDSLAAPADLQLARHWGLTLRLGQRLCGGAAEPLESAHLVSEKGALILSLVRESAALYGEPVVRRHRSLALALGLEPKLRLLTRPELQALAS